MKPNSIEMLIAEDDDHLRGTICDLFSLFGFKVTGVADGQSAWELLEKNKYSIVISDIRMPRLSGFDLLQQVKDRDSNFPKFIMISGYSDYTVKELCQAGADGFFTKPIDSTQIRASIRKFLVANRERWAQEPHMSTPNKISKKLSDFELAIEKGEIAFGRNGFFLPLNSNIPKVNEEVRFDLSFGNSKTSLRMHGFGHVVFETDKAKGDETNGVGVEITHLNKEAIEKVVGYIEATQPISSIPYL